MRLVAAALALSAGMMLAQAQQPATPAQPSAAAPAVAAPAPAAAGKTPAKTGAAQGAPSQKSAASYSLGVMWGEQLRSTGLAPASVSAERIAQGVRDGLAGKATVSDQDRENIRALATSAGDANHKAAAKFLAENGRKPGVVTTASGLQYQELKAGSGDSPRATDSVTVNYRGMLLDGTEFDSSYKRGEPATFEVDRVIPGWTEALQLMKPGAKWKLFVPPQLAYDMRPHPPIPPGAMLLFDVELLSVKAAPAAAANPAAATAPASPPHVPASALPQPTGKPPVNPPESPNAPSPAAIKPASK
jgi:FKBP-type peptidyl-prolyl cis-trans isomerase